MAGSADAPTSPDIRASDAERDAAVSELRDHFVAGRISHDTFLHRIGTAMDARRLADLPPLFADLPIPRGPGGWWPGGWAGTLRKRVREALPDRMLPERMLPDRVRPGRARRGDVPDRSAAPPRPTAAFEAAPAAARGPASLRFPRGAAATFSIGRDRDCDLSIEDMTVSRVHARLDRGPDGWLLTDLGSTNGTRVNGWLVRDPVEVRPGDLVRFGETEYVLGEPGSA